MRTTSIEELLEDFEFLDSWEDRYRYIIELGDELEDLDAELRVEENRVQGCVSNVWLLASFDASSPPQISFRADSDSQLVRGLVSAAFQVQHAKVHRRPYVIAISRQRPFILAFGFPKLAFRPVQVCQIIICFADVGSQGDGLVVSFECFA